jgi:uridine kinase
MATFAPFVQLRRPTDSDVLGRCPLFAGLPGRDLEAIVPLLEVCSADATERIVTRGEAARGAFVVLEGEVLVDGGPRTVLSAGAAWGEAALEVETPEPRTRSALGAARLCHLSRTRFRELSRTHPTIAFELLRRALVLVVLTAESRSAWAPLGARRARDLLPAEVDGALVVAAREENRTICLAEAVSASASLTAVTTRDWEGREVYRRSAGLVFLEAAARLGFPALRLGPSWTSGRPISGIEPANATPLFAQRITTEMAALIKADVPIHDEAWRLEDAVAHFAARGWDDARSLLDIEPRSHVRLATCGDVLVPTPGTMLPSTGLLSDVRVYTYAEGLFLDFGERVRSTLAKRPLATMVLETEAPRYGAGMTNEERIWLDKLGIVSVGAFNQACIRGEVRELVDVAEGFHEKRLASLADDIAARPDARIVAVAGPSSAGKTTFLKRLATQLRVSGITPIGISLDDYYLDRERTAKDANGDYDYEALEALDRELLHKHLEALLAGGAVRTARYDFITGKSDPSGGSELRLAPSSVLILEGMHALNPALYLGDAGAKTFGVFIHPATALPFDPLSTFEPADVRLLRRIVRDRHGRGATAERNLARWGSVRRGERVHVDPWRPQADRIFDTSLIYEVNVLKIFAERYLLEVPRSSPEFPAATRLRRLLAPFVPIYPERVPPTSILREFIGVAGFDY